MDRKYQKDKEGKTVLEEQEQQDAVEGKGSLQNDIKEGEQDG